MDSIVNKVYSKMEGVVQELREEVRHGKAETVSEIRKVKFQEPHQFRKRAHEEQFKANQKISEHMEEAQEALKDSLLSKSWDKVQEASVSLETGVCEINQRQKLILIADSSELGWKTVGEYVANPLADDSDDEQKLIKAENRAARKAKAEKERKKVGKRRRFQPYSVPAAQQQATFMMSGGVAAPPFGSPMRFGRGGPKPTDICRGCGQLGHWRVNCPAIIKIGGDPANTSSTMPKISNVSSTSLGPVKISGCRQVGPFVG
ncbi:MAG: hypothetical protein MJA29_05915, partial [Candidatus Omnitrophica bacterium]|nr:hypothetical protein [Candidatus Omnitrophota bacterium]